MQVPMHPFLLLVCFNAFSESVHPWLPIAASWWGKILQWSSPGFIVMEGMSSLLVAQRLGQVGKGLVGEGEVYQFRKNQFDANGKPFPSDLYSKLSQARN